MKLTLAFIYATISLACNSIYTEENVNTKIYQTDTGKAVKPVIENLFDTTISFQKFVSEKNPTEEIKVREAVEFIYSYYLAKGIQAKSNLKVNEVRNPNQLLIDFDTMYSIRILNHQYYIASFWLGTIDQNGHCFQPDRALLVRANNKISIQEEISLPPNLVIDSIVAGTLFGYEYDCGGKGKLRHFRIHIE